MIVVTHEMDFARDVADRMMFMEGGVIVEAGPPDEMFRQAQHQRTRDFLARVTVHHSRPEPSPTVDITEATDQSGHR